VVVLCLGFGEDTSIVLPGVVLDAVDLSLQKLKETCIISLAVANHQKAGPLQFLVPLFF